VERPNRDYDKDQRDCQDARRQRTTKRQHVRPESCGTANRDARDQDDDREHERPVRVGYGNIEAQYRKSAAAGYGNPSRKRCCQNGGPYERASHGC
jgi:hypothetical protein